MLDRKTNQVDKYISGRQQKAVKMDSPRNPPSFVDSQKLLEMGPEVLSIVANYWDTLRERKPRPDAKPFEVFDLFPEEAPQEPESWCAILDDVETHILAKNTHWSHPHFFSYFPNSCTYPAVLADILGTAIACSGFTWNSSQSSTEIELAMLDWLARAMSLPEYFLNSHQGPGGGIIQPTACDSTLVAVMAARSRILRPNEDQKPFTSTEAISETPNSGNTGIIGTIKNKMMSILSAVVPKGRQMLTMYCSAEAHCSVERAGLLANVTVRHVKTDAKLAMRGEALQRAVDEDKGKGLTPFCVVATLGTTPTCAFDNLVELGQVCKKESMWLHVDAAYAGSALVCPELRFIAEGIEHLHIAISRRFRAIKVWFVMRAFGISGLQANIRQCIRLAKEFEAHVRAEDDFEVVNDVVLGLVCFRLKGENSRSERLRSELEKDGSIQLTPSISNGLYYLRLSVGSTLTTSEDIQYAFDVIRRCAEGC